MLGDSGGNGGPGSTFVGEQLISLESTIVVSLRRVRPCLSALSFCCAEEQVSRKISTMGDNGRPPVKLCSAKRLVGIVGAQRVVLFGLLPTGGSLVSSFTEAASE